MNTQQLWQSQALDAPRISLAYVRHHADSLRRRTRTVNAISYVVGTVGISILVWRCIEFFSASPLLSIAIGLWVAAGLTGLFLQLKRAAAEDQPAQLGVLDALRFYRRQLERQRDARRGSSLWAPLLFVPGHVVYFASFFTDFSPVPWKVVILHAAIITVGTWIAIATTLRRARRIQQEIDALDSL